MVPVRLSSEMSNKRQLKPTNRQTPQIQKHHKMKQSLRKRSLPSKRLGSRPRFPKQFRDQNFRQVSQLYVRNPKFLGNQLHHPPCHRGKGTRSAPIRPLCRQNHQLPPSICRNLGRQQTLASRKNWRNRVNRLTRPFKKIGKYFFFYQMCISTFVKA